MARYAGSPAAIWQIPITVWRLSIVQTDGRGGHRIAVGVRPDDGNGARIVDITLILVPVVW